jgi:hypothetical protein
MSNELSGLYNELISLCEIRGELSPEDNAAIEVRIQELNERIKDIEYMLEN